MNPHCKHQALAHKGQLGGWTECVTPAACAADPRRQAAHGGVMRQDECRCGAVRRAEKNQGRVNYGPWEENTR